MLVYKVYYRKFFTDRSVYIAVSEPKELWKTLRKYKIRNVKAANLFCRDARYIFDRNEVLNLWGVGNNDYVITPSPAPLEGENFYNWGKVLL